METLQVHSLRAKIAVETGYLRARDVLVVAAKQADGFTSSLENEKINGGSILDVVDAMGEEEAVCSRRAVVREGRDAASGDTTFPLVRLRKGTRCVEFRGGDLRTATEWRQNATSKLQSKN